MQFDGGAQLVSSIAIYHGYNNRELGNYTLRDDLGNLIGSWRDVNLDGTADAVWLRLKTPVMTSRLTIESAAISGSITPSYREIQNGPSTGLEKAWLDGVHYGDPNDAPLSL